MTEQELYDLLKQNIAFQLRHPHYDRTVEVAKFCRMVTTGEGQREEITRYRRFEQEELKEQRIRLNNPITPIFISEPDKMFDKMTRVDGVRRDVVVSSDKVKQDLEAAMWNFRPGKDLETWLVDKMRHLGKTDPNAFVLYDRYDRRAQDGNIQKTVLRPVIYRSIDVLNYQYDGEGLLSWVLFREIRMEYALEGRARRQKMLEDFYMYAPQMLIRGREVGENTAMQDGEELVSIEVYPIAPKDGERAKSTPFDVSQPKRRDFYVRTIEHGAGEVPAFCVGVYPDEQTDQETFVSWFYPAKPVLLDVIRDKQMHDVETVMSAFRRRWELAPPCEYETEDGHRCGEISRGHIETLEGRKTCPACNGAGVRPNFTTEQEVNRVILPPDAEGQARMMELAKMSFEEPIDTTLLQYWDAKMEVHRQRFLSAVFSGGMFTKPTGTEAQTATETIEKTNMAADILRPFGLAVSSAWEQAYRVLAAYREVGQITVNHSYPEQIDLLTLEQEIANFAAIQQVDIYEAKVHQRHRVLAKQFEGEPETHRRIEARYRFLPFDDKSPQATAQIIASLSPTDDNVILWTYWLQIFQEIEQADPKFHEKPYPAQKAVVDAKIEEFRGRVQLAGGGVDTVPDFNAQDDEEEQTASE